LNSMILLRNSRIHSFIAQRSNPNNYEFRDGETPATNVASPTKKTTTKNVANYLHHHMPEHLSYLYLHHNDLVHQSVKLEIIGSSHYLRTIQGKTLFDKIHITEIRDKSSLSTLIPIQYWTFTNMARKVGDLGFESRFCINNNQNKLGINPRNSSEMWLVDRIKPNYKKTQRSRYRYNVYKVLNYIIRNFTNEINSRSQEWWMDEEVKLHNQLQGCTNKSKNSSLLCV
ncbi:hypothetical protein L9F63_020495, partial [Diploptera punctata]